MDFGEPLGFDLTFLGLAVAFSSSGIRNLLEYPPNSSMQGTMKLPLTKFSDSLCSGLIGYFEMSSALDDSNYCC